MAARINTVHFNCAQCGGPASRYVSGGKPARYCSNACKVRSHRKGSPDKATTYRTDEARRLRIANAHRVRYAVLRGRPKPEPKQPVLRYCPDCQTALGKREIRCGPCREVARLKVLRECPSRRADKARRKAMRRGKCDGAERFDPLEVLARDGWRCHICGVGTPKRLRGTFHDRAPELDHIVPLAVGGKHTRQNTACACRKCNIEKGSEPRGQLRLVA